MKEILFPNEVNETIGIKVENEAASQMPSSHQNENETTPEMKHSPITDWNSLTWLCYLCEESFNGFENLSIHQESLHKDRNKEEDHFICFDCKETLSEYSIFLNHIRSRHYNSLKLCCDACNKVLPDYAQLAEHREEHIEYTNEIHPTVYHCNLCEEVAATERILKLHTQECHDLKPGDATKQNNPSDVFVLEEFNSTQIMADQKSLTEDVDLWLIFKSWELCDETCHILFSFGITSTTILKKMEIEDVEYLFNKLERKYTGELIKFKAGLREWRRNINLPFICQRETLSANSRILEWLEEISDRLCNSKSTDCPYGTQMSAENSICGTSLINLLKSTVKGQLVLTFNERNKFLDSKNQKTLVHCIVEKYVGNKAKFTYAEMQQWAYAICEVFTKEKPETYFLKRKDGKKNPSGKLFSRWANVEKEKLGNDPATEDESLQYSHSDTYFEQKCWLQHNCSPWDQVLSFWRETRQSRIQEIRNASSLKHILQEWPRYNDYLGYELVEIDFDFLYPDKANQLFLKLETFYKKLFKIFDHEIKDRASREYYIQHLRNENITKDSKYCVCTVLLHALLQPQRLNKEYKPSIADAQTDFVTLVPTINDIQPKIIELANMYAERRETLQPRIMVVGPDYSKISDFFVFCDGLKWKCASYMKCVDIIIKLTNVFKTEYSTKSKQVWSFLEQYFFELKSEDFASVANLLSKLQ